MSAITANREGGSAARHGAPLDPASARRPSGPQGAQTSRGLPPAAAVVKRSETDQAVLDRLKTAQDAVANATRSFDERLKLRSDALASRLSAAFAEKGIPLDDPVSLRIESGIVVSDSPYRKKIEKMFRDDPELAKEFESVASLKAMRAAQKSLELYNDEKKSARSRDEQEAAYGRYTARMLDIQKLSGVMTLKDGALSSAAEDYMGVMSGATPAATSDPRGEVLKRYGSILRTAA